MRPMLQVPLCKSRAAERLSVPRWPPPLEVRKPPRPIEVPLLQEALAGAPREDKARNAPKGEERLSTGEEEKTDGLFGLAEGQKGGGAER